MNVSLVTLSPRETPSGEAGSQRAWKGLASGKSGQGPAGFWKLEEGGAETLPRTLANLEGTGRTILPPQPLGPFIHSMQFMTWFAFGWLVERGF